MKIIQDTECSNPLQKDPYFDGVSPQPLPSFNVASYVNHSELLQEMVKLNVEIYRWDKKQEIHEIVLKKDFNTDVRPVIQFLVDNGLKAEDLGKFFTRNPMILDQDLDELQTRVNYLQTKKFSRDDIARVLTRNPFWIMFSTTRIDARLGFFQRAFRLSGNEVRSLSRKEPRLITCNLWNVKEMTFGIREEMGFDERQVKTLFLSKPKLWMKSRETLVDRFDFIHNVMKLNHETILKFPAILTCRDFRLKQRHQYLCFRNRNQYDPCKENYVSPLDIIRGSDADFCLQVAHSSVIDYNNFCKTL
nr:EOG090X0C5Y [Cyclestheria hislopi]